MKPNPLLSLNHFTVPCAMKNLLLLRTGPPPCGLGAGLRPPGRMGSRTFDRESNRVSPPKWLDYMGGGGRLSNALPRSPRAADFFQRGGTLQYGRAVRSISLPLARGAAADVTACALLAGAFLVLVAASDRVT